MLMAEKWATDLKPGADIASELVKQLLAQHFGK